jgi:hypothetical protein
VQGKVTLPPLAPPLEPLKRLLTSNEADAKDFRQHIRSYNNALAFTFVGADLDTSVAHFFSLARRQNLPNCTSTIRMPSLITECAILVA